MEGYYPIIVSVVGTTADLTVEPITKETGLTAEDMDMVIATDTIPYIVIAKKDAAWGKSFADLVKYGKEHPGELKYISNQVGSGNDLAMEWVLNQVGVEVTKIPAPSNDAVAAAIGAGEGDFSMSQAGVALQHYQAGKVEVLSSPAIRYPPLGQGREHSLRQGRRAARFAVGRRRGLRGAEGRAAGAHRLALQAVRRGCRTEHHKQRETTVPGARIALYEPAEANKLKMQVLEFADPVVREMGLHIDQK